jgi:hypothetical protein
MIKFDDSVLFEDIITILKETFYDKNDKSFWYDFYDRPPYINIEHYEMATGKEMRAAFWIQGPKLQSWMGRHKTHKKRPFSSHTLLRHATILDKARKRVESTQSQINDLESLRQFHAQGGTKFSLGISLFHNPEFYYHFNEKTYHAHLNGALKGYY